MKFELEVLDRDTFTVKAHIADGAGHVVERGGIVEKHMHPDTGRDTGYWRARVFNGPEEPIKVAKSRGGCIFAIIQHYARI